MPCRTSGFSRTFTPWMSTPAEREVSDVQSSHADGQAMSSSLRNVLPLRSPTSAPLAAPTTPFSVRTMLIQNSNNLRAEATHRLLRRTLHK